MATLQIRVDDTLKKNADALFSSLGLDTSTAVRMFLYASLEYDGLPFSVNHRKPNIEMQEAINDTRSQHNLNGPYATAGDAVKAMLEN